MSVQRPSESNDRIATSKRNRKLLWIVIPLMLLFVVGMWIAFPRKSDAQKLMLQLAGLAREGLVEETLVKVAGSPDQVIAGDKAPDWLVKTTIQRWPETGIRPDDKFLVYNREHNKSGGITQYVQVRDGKLINVDSEFPDPEKYKITGAYKLN